MTESYNRYTANNLGNSKLFIGDCTIIHSHQEYVRVLVSVYSNTTLDIVILPILTGMWRYHIVVSISIFLMTNDIYNHLVHIWYSFTYLVFMYLTCSNLLPIFLLLVLRIFKHILYTKSYWTYDRQILSPNLQSIFSFFVFQRAHILNFEL